MRKDPSVTPQHKVCMGNVDVPTILVVSTTVGKEVVLQWFGEATDAELVDCQFHFPVPISVESIHWMGHPEKCKVVFLGEVRNWPRPDAAQEVADSVTEGRMDKIIAWVIAPHYKVAHENEVGPESFAFPMPIMLADGNCGIIKPKCYCDMSILEEEGS